MEESSVKKCKDCDVEKLIEDFYSNKTMKNGRSNRCKACTKRIIPIKKKDTHTHCIECSHKVFKLNMVVIDGYFLCKSCFVTYNLENVVSITKACHECKIYMPLDDFNLDSSKKDRRHSICKTCKLAYRKYFKIHKVIPVEQRTKVCIHCNVDKDIKLFTKRLSNIDGRSGECRECLWKIDKKWRDKNPEKIKTKLLKKYGMSLEQYNEMLEKQNGVCYICKQNNKNNSSLHVDHDHITGQVRKLLCANCNSGLGHCRESIDILQKMIDYIRDHNDQSKMGESA